MSNFLEDIWQQAEDWWYGDEDSQDSMPNEGTSQNNQPQNSQQSNNQQQGGDPLIPLMFVGGLLVIGTGFFIYRTLKGN